MPGHKAQPPAFTGLSDELFQVFFEIALSIGISKDLNRMLKNSIVSYIRKLFCSAACVIRYQKRSDGTYESINEFSVPYTIEVKETFRKLIESIPRVESETDYHKMTSRDPVVMSADEGLFVYTFSLPGFGILLLVRRDEPFSEPVIRLIRNLNKKLAESAVACLQIQALEENEARYRDLTDMLPEMICETDLYGTITFVNQYALDKSGYSKEEALDHFPIYKVIRKEEHSRFAQEMKRCLETRTQVTTEFSFVKKDGTNFTGSVYIMAIAKRNTVIGFRGVVIDITDRRNYEVRLKDNTDRLELALSGSGSGLWDWNIPTGQIHTHGWYEKITGFETDEIASSIDGHLDLIHPDDRATVNDAISRHFSDQSEVYSCEYRVRCRDGSWKWLLDTGKIVETDESGNPLRMTGIQLDITHKKSVEENLKQNLQQQELLSVIAIGLNNLNNFDDKIQNTLELIGRHTRVSRTYIFEDDNTGNFTTNTYEWCNQGIPAQKQNLVSIPYEAVPTWRERLLTEGAIVASEIRIFPQELFEILEAQGIFSLVVYPITIAGKYAGFIGFDECTGQREWTHSEQQLLKIISGIISNAFERRHTEWSLKESFATNRAIVSSLPDKLLHCNRNGDILNVNFSDCEGCFLLTPDIGINLSQALPQSLSDLFIQSICLCIEQGSYNFSFQSEHYGETTYHETRLAKVNEDEAILLVRDVTMDRKREDTLKNAIERAEKASQAKSEFLANMSHEIRTPMNGVIGMASLLSKSIMTKEQSDMVDTIRSSGELLLSIINDILDFSKIESGNMELEMNPIDLRLCLEDILDQFSTRVNEKGLSLYYFVDPKIRTKLKGDKIRLNQILVNLIGNAIKFTHAGAITIGIRMEPLTKQVARFQFSVRDSGIGIPQEKIHMLFKPFSQVNSANNRQYAGTGLGLAITARLVKMMGGTIEVISTPDVGSDFRFSIVMELLDAPDFIPSKHNPVIIRNEVSNPDLRLQIEHFLEVAGIQPAHEPHPDALIISDDHTIHQMKEKVIQTGMPRTIGNSESNTKTLSVPIKMSTFLKTILPGILESPSSAVNDDPEDLNSQFPIRILVAEDNRTNQKLMLQTLNYYGYMPGLAQNGQEALDALKEKPYDLIFMDIQMPEMDGLEATRIINRLYKSEKPVIIAMTASALLEEKELCFMAGVDDFFSKPAKMENIGDMIQKWGPPIMSKKNKNHLTGDRKL